MRILFLALLSSLAINIQAQPDPTPKNITLVSHLTLPNDEDGNDVWGYVDESGLEYAIMGGEDHTYIWSLEDYENPTLRVAIEGTNTIWRDMKSWEDHIYVTKDNFQGDENYDGLLVIDMSGAPEDITWDFQRDTYDVGDGPEQLGSCHNIYIDEDGYAYLAGCNVGSGGVIILDLADKDHPKYVGVTNDRYSHDAYARDSILYTSDVYDGIFSIYDIRDRSNPQFINGGQTTFNFTHNAWLSDDGDYLFTTDERGNAYVEAWDISDLQDLERVDRFRPLETENQGVIPHNVHYFDGYLVTSWYTDGLRVIDAHKPDNLIEVAKYDSWDGQNGGFFGCWGAYPFLPSGKVLISDINSGLYILDVDYKRASYLEGKITDANTGQPIVNTSITIQTSDLNEENSDPAGNYKTGIAESGTFEVQYVHPDYEVATVMVTLVSGEVTIQDIALNQSNLLVNVIDENSNPIEDAKVFLSNANSGQMTEVTTGENGTAVIGLRSNETYTIQSSKWGYKGTELTDFFFDQTGTTATLTLTDGYEDDFFADLGWTINSTASAGAWTRGVPNITSNSGQVANPGADAEGDIGDYAYVTGNAAGVSWTQDDIDNGYTTIQSPDMDWTNHLKYTIEFDTWYFITGSEGVPNDDSLFVYLGNGSDEILLHREEVTSLGWNSWSYDLTEEQIPFTANMYLRIRASDENQGNLVEAGFDKFRAIPEEIISTTNLDIDWKIEANPNPFFDRLQIKSTEQNESRIIVSNLLGIEVFNQSFTNYKDIDTKNWIPGVYLIQLKSETTHSPIRKVIKH